ncbi:SLBB domain-containing protein [Treponema sp. HNW]|uniref:polysaccharide biosynthesis/export family protein n=1 Tax=Treponema sp. HNW TaxID=3116654 RepID=UPI003D13363A
MKRIIASLIIALYTACLNAQNIDNALQQYLQKQNTADNGTGADIAQTMGHSAQLAMSTADYPVTAGDVYMLGFAAGTTPVSYTLTVDTSYKIRVANLAVLNAAGKTFRKLKEEVEAIVSKNYPLSGVQFVLITPGAFTVLVKGEVNTVAEKNAWGLTRVSEIIGGSFTAYSSNRNIVLESPERTVRCDIFKARRTGDLTLDPYVRPGDIITVGRVERRVGLTGAVERPGTYDLLENENIKELIHYYGSGLTPFANMERIEIENSLSNTKTYIDKKDFESNTVLKHLDTVFVDTLENTKPFVYIQGAVGTYGAQVESGRGIVTKTENIPLPFLQNTDWTYIVRQQRDLFSVHSDIEKTYILRKGQKLPINVQRILYDSEYSVSLPAEAGDILSVPAKQLLVTVSGNVNMPERYGYVPDCTYEYYLALAGGITSGNKKTKSISITTAAGKKIPLSAPVMPESIINVYDNNFLLFWNQYAPVVVTALSIISTSLTIWAVSREQTRK